MKLAASIILTGVGFHRFEQGCEPQRLNIDRSVVLPDYKVIVNKLKQLRGILFARQLACDSLYSPASQNLQTCCYLFDGIFGLIQALLYNLHSKFCGLSAGLQQGGGRRILASRPDHRFSSLLIFFPCCMLSQQCLHILQRFRS